MGYLAWDTRTGEILYSLPRPQGNFDKLNWEFVFFRRPEVLPYIGTSDSGPELTTREAQRKLRVIDGIVMPKPLPRLSIALPTEGEECSLIVGFDHLLENDNLTDITAVVSGEKLEPAELHLQPGDNPLVFDVLGELAIRITDKRVQEASVRFEVMPVEGD